LRNPAGRSQPGAEQRPEAFDGVDVSFAKTITILIASIPPLVMTDRLMLKASVGGFGIDLVFISHDRRLRRDCIGDQQFDRVLFDIRKHADGDL
jgi:hypothetical protein